MWIMTTTGFYSVVVHRTEPDLLLVRCRVRADAMALHEACAGTSQPYQDQPSDYPWRLTARRDDFRDWLSREAGQIDYDNFKNAVKARQGSWRASIYMRVWSALLALQGHTPRHRAAR